MDKIQALQCQELQDEMRFKETMVRRDHIFKIKSEIENMEKRAQKARQEINQMEPERCQMEMDVKMLDTQIEELTKNIREKLEKVLRHENKLKRSKDSFQKLLRDKIEEIKPILTRIRTKKNPNTSENAPKETEEIAQVWALQGETEALTLIEQYQRTKIEEINHIIDIAREQSHLPNVANVLLKDV